MIPSSRWRSSAALFACSCVVAWSVHAQQPPAAGTEATGPTAAEASGPAAPQAQGPAAPEAHDLTGRAIVSIGHDSSLAKGEHADAVVSVLGSSTADGDVADSVVAVLGDARVTGRVGDSVVAVLGDVYVDSKIDGNVVAVLGNVTLGPQAEVDGNVVEVFGELHRSPTAIVHSGVQRVFPSVLVGSGALRAWVRHCLLYGRPLALDREVAWVWGLALTALALYVVLAAVFHDGIARCVHTLETQPGHSILAMLLSILITPVLFLLLTMTVIGIAVIPIVWMGIVCAGLFGRATTLAWIGGRCTRLFRGAEVTPAAVNVVIGGVLVLALYLIPLIGFIAYALVGAVGFGAVIYTLVLSANAARAARAAAGAHPASAGAASAARAAPAAAATASNPNTSTADAAPSGPAAEAAAGEHRTQDAAPGAAALQAVTLPHAGFWIRMGALLIDVLLVGFALSLLHNTFRSELLVLAAYAAVMWKVKGTTIGGIVCDLRVVRLDGRPVDWGTAVVRALGCILSLAVVGLGFLWIVFDPEQQAWHDKIAGTIVVRVPHGVPLV